MDEILKGNFRVKNPILLNEKQGEEKATLTDQLRKRALASLGGSMVYVERNQLMWEGDV